MRTSRAVAPMFGRDTELALLRSNFVRAASGNPRTVLLTGEAGIGRSRLVAEFLAGLGDDVLVAEADCVDLGPAGVPFAPVRRMLRTLEHSLGREPVLEAAGFGANTLATLLGDPAAALAASGAGSVGLLAEAVELLLRNISAERPLVLVIEDIQWADAATLMLIRSLVGTLDGTRFMGIATLRSDEVGRGDPLRSLLAELQRSRNVVRVDLKRLSREDVTAMITEASGRTPRQDEVDTLTMRSQGIPFYVEELMGAGVNQMPDTLREVLLAPYERMGDLARTLVRCASVSGTRVDHDTLVGVFGHPESHVESACTEAILHGILVRDGHGYSFRHHLVREAVHEELLPGERARYHRAFAEVLAARQTSSAAELARHWLEGQDAERGFEALLTASAEARAGYGWASAAQFGERILSLWDQLEAPEERVGPRWQVKSLIARDWDYAGDVPRAIHLQDEAIAECPPEQQRAHARMLLENHRRRVRTSTVSPADALHRALELVTPGHDPEDLAIRADIRVLQAADLLAQGRSENCLDLLDEAQTAADDLARPDLQVRVAALRSWTVSDQGNARRALDVLALVDPTSTTDLESRLQYGLRLAQGLHHSGDYLAASAVCEQYVELSRQVGRERPWGVALLAVLAECGYDSGQWLSARETVTRALALAPEEALHSSLLRLRVRHTAWENRIEQAWHLASEQTARIASAAAVDHTQRVSWAITLAELALERHDPPTALTSITEVWSDPTCHLPRLEGPLCIVAARTVSALQAWDEPAATRLRALVEDHLRRIPHDTSAAAMRLMAQAELAGHRQPTLARGAWQACVERLARDGGPCYLLPNALLHLASAQAANGERGAAGLSVRRGLELSEGLGYAQLGSKLRDFARVAGLTLADDGALPSAGGASELTNREHQVLELVAEGLSNRQIASALFISPKTVSVHVSAILAKLGVSSRTEAAARSLQNETKSRGGLVASAPAIPLAARAGHAERG